MQIWVNHDNLYNNTLISRDTCPANCVSRDTCPANCVSRDTCPANCVSRDTCPANCVSHACQANRVVQTVGESDVADGADWAAINFNSPPSCELAAALLL